MTWHDMTWHDMTWHDMTWHDMTWHDMTWHDMTWHVPVLYDMYMYDMTCTCVTWHIPVWVWHNMYLYDMYLYYMTCACRHDMPWHPPVWQLPRVDTVAWRDVAGNDKCLEVIAVLSQKWRLSPHILVRPVQITDHSLSIQSHRRVFTMSMWLVRRQEAMY